VTGWRGEVLVHVHAEARALERRGLGFAAIDGTLDAEPGGGVRGSRSPASGPLVSSTAACGGSVIGAADRLATQRTARPEDEVYLDSVRDDLAAVVSRALEPALLSVWLNRHDSAIGAYEARSYPPGVFPRRPAIIGCSYGRYCPRNYTRSWNRLTGPALTTTECADVS
jgi:hypothetical protein